MGTDISKRRFEFVSHSREEIFTHALQILNRSNIVQDENRAGNCAITITQGGGIRQQVDILTVFNGNTEFCLCGLALAQRAVQRTFLIGYESACGAVSCNLAE